MKRTYGHPILASLLAVAFLVACPEEEKVQPGFYTFTLSLGDGFNSKLITGLELVLDSDPGGLPLQIPVLPEREFLSGGVSYTLEAKNVDDDPYPEIVVTFEQNPFPTGTSFQFQLLTPPGRDEPFSVRASVLSKNGVLATANATQHPDGQPLLFGGGIRRELALKFDCTPGFTCTSTVNRLPEMAPLPAEIAIRRWWTLTLVVDAQDADGDPLTFGVDLDGLPQGTNARFDRAARTFTWTPSDREIRATPYNVRFTVNDGRGGQDAKSLRIRVVEANSVPVWMPTGNKVAAEGATLRVPLQAYDPDPEPLTFTLDKSGLPRGSDAEFDPQTRVFSWTPTVRDGRDRPYPVRITARDPQGASSTLSFDVVVLKINQAPFISVSGSYVLQAGQKATIPFAVSDVDEDPVTVAADLSGLPPGHDAALDATARTITWTPRSTDASDKPYDLRLIAQDAKGAKYTALVHLLVRSDNASPVITPLPVQSVEEEQPLTFTLQVADSDQSVSVRADLSLLPLGHNAALQGLSFSWTPAAGTARNDPYTVTFTATDSRGLATGLDVLIRVGVDTLAPNAPVLATTEPPSPSSSRTVTVSGTAERGATVRLYATAGCTGDPLGMAVATDGTFSIQVTVAANAVTSLVATATDRSGNVSACSAAFPFRHDDVPPAAPALTGTLPASPSNDLTPKVTGIAEANATVEIYVAAGCQGAVVASGQASAMGTFEIETLVDDDATTMIFARAIDEAGNPGPCSATGISYTHDGTPPPAPNFTSTSPASPNKDSAQPLIVGLAEAKSKVRLYTNDTCTGAATAEGTASDLGIFSILVSVPQNATTVFHGTAEDGVGNVSGCSTSAIAYTHDNRMPDPPVLTGVFPQSPSNDPNPTILGTAEPGSTVTIFRSVDCTENTAVGTPAVAAANGTFSSQVPANANGPSEFRARARDAAGNVSPCSTTGIAYLHDGVPPPKPAITSPAANAVSKVNPVAVMGTAPEAATARIFTSGDCTGSFVTANVDTQGNFTASVGVAANQSSMLSVRSFDAAGNMSECSVARTYTHDDMAPAAPVFTSTTPGSPSKSVTNPTLEGTAEGGATLRIYRAATASAPGCAAGNLVKTVTVAGTGPNQAFSESVTVGANSDNYFTADAEDAATNRSLCSPTPRRYVHDNMIDQTVLTNLIPQTTTGTPSNNPSPRVIGTAEKGASVFIYRSANCTGTSIATGTADASTGAFDITASVADPNSTVAVQFSAKAVDAATNESCSGALTFHYDGQKPAAPTLMSSPPSPSQNQNPTLSGTTDAGTTVSLYKSSDCSGTPLATDSDGSTGFSFPVTADNNTTTQYSVRAVDAATNASDCTSVAYRHDTQGPPSPTMIAVTPDSPSSDPTVIVSGTAVDDPVGPAVNVRIYLSGNCSGAPVTTDKTDTEFSVGVEITVPLNMESQITARAVDGLGNEGPCSAPITYRHDNTPPTAPTVSLTPLADEASIQVGWTASTDTGGSGVKHYIVLRDGTQVGTPVTGTTITDQGLTQFTTYNYTVKAVDNAGNEASGMASATTAFGCTVVSGNIATQTWSGTRCVTADVTVMPSETLTINPGVTVRFGSGTSLIVNGQLNAQGTSGSIIEFQSAKATPAAGDWGRVHFGTTGTTGTVDGSGNCDANGSVLKHVRIRHAGAGTHLAAVYADFRPPCIQNATITGNAGSGVRAVNNPQHLRVLDSTVSNNAGGRGINVTGGRATILRNMVTGNAPSSGAGGIDISGITDATAVEDNTVTANAGDGVSVASGGGAVSVKRNLVGESSGRGIVITAGVSPLVQQNIVFGNGDFGLVLAGTITSGDASQNSLVDNVGNISFEGGDGTATVNHLSRSRTRASVTASTASAGGWSFTGNNVQTPASLAFVNFTGTGTFNAAGNWLAGSTSVTTPGGGTVDTTGTAAEPLDGPPISPPTGIVATPSTGQIVVTWAANPEPGTQLLGYRAFVGSVHLGPYQSVMNVGTTTATFTNLTPGTYLVTVTAIDVTFAGDQDQPRADRAQQVMGLESWYGEEKMVVVPP
jgi:hypothetical protein